MLAMLQRIARGRVTSEGELLAECPGPGLLVLLGVTTEDEEEDALLLADKIAKLRIFSDEEGKMNRSVTDVGGGVIVVSQFTLCAAYRYFFYIVLMLGLEYFHQVHQILPFVLFYAYHF